MRPNQKTRQVHVGNVALGGGAPVVVQSMLNAPADDAQANLAQIQQLAAAGCEVVRMAIPRRSCLDTFQAVCEESPLPVVADVHFDATIAIEAARRGAAKLRINPGNIGGLAKTDAVLDAAGQAGIPIRIGVNAGSLDQALAERNDLSLPEKLAASARQYVEYCEGRGFHDLVVSAKAHDVMPTVRTYRQLAREVPHIPLHIGGTEAGTTFQGVIKSASGLGILLEQGIGDTMRISLTDDPVTEIRACWTLLAALDLRRRSPELISCPTCGRCQVNLIGLAQEVEQRLATVDKPVKVAVMGCVVNGPGEAADADIARIQAAIDDSLLTAPREGRIQYRIAPPGGVLSAGGRVLNLVDLTDVYMTFFLPEEVAGKVSLGADVRLVFDAIPDIPIPAEVSYVASVAQFSPKTVETQSERQKLMFRVKARIDPALLRKYIKLVKTGIPGVTWVKLDPAAEWPEALQLKKRKL